MRITGTDGQELGGGQMSRFEGTAATTGTYEGKKVTGWNYVEMVGKPRSDLRLAQARVVRSRLS